MRTASALLAIALAGCFHDAPATSSAKPTTPLAAKPAASAHPVDDLSLLPIDAEIVLGIDFAKLRKAPAWQKYAAPKLATLPGLDKFKALCGFDALDSLRSVVLGLKDLDGDAPTGAVVLHGYDRKQAMSCFDKDGIAEAQADGSKVSIDRGIAVVDKAGKKVGFTFVDDSTALVVIGPDATIDALDAFVHGAADARGLRASATFTGYLSRVDTHSTAWLVVNGKAPAFQKASGMGFSFDALYGSADLQTGLAIDAHVKMASADAANNMTSMMKAQFGNPTVAGFFDHFDVSNKDADLHVSVEMSEAKLEQMAQMLGIRP